LSIGSISADGGTRTLTKNLPRDFKSAGIIENHTHFKVPSCILIALKMLGPRSEVFSLLLCCSARNYLRFLQQRALGSLPTPFLLVLVAWLEIIFFGVGLFAKREFARIAPSRSATWPEARQRPPPDTGIVCEEVSWRSLPRK
jgi:hypothetical protein